MLRRVDKNTMVMFGAVVSTAIQKVGKCREGIDSWEHRGEREPRSQARERRWWLSPGAQGVSSQEGKRPPAASPGGAPLSSSLRRLGQFLSFLGSRSAGARAGLVPAAPAARPGSSAGFATARSLTRLPLPSVVPGAGRVGCSRSFLRRTRPQS